MKDNNLLFEVGEKRKVFSKHNFCGHERWHRDFCKSKVVFWESFEFDFRLLGSSLGFFGWDRSVGVRKIAVLTGSKRILLFDYDHRFSTRQRERRERESLYNFGYANWKQLATI